MKITYSKSSCCTDCVVKDGEHNQNLVHLVLIKDKCLEHLPTIMDCVPVELRNEIKEILILNSPPSYSLTKREVEVIRLVKQGKTTNDIAQILGITKSTVKFHIKNIFLKLNAKTRSEAVSKIIDLGRSNTY